MSYLDSVSDEKYLEKKFLNNYNKNTTTAKFIREGAIIGVGFCDIGERLDQSTALIATVGDAMVNALEYYDDSPETFWNRNLAAKEKLEGYFGDINDLKQADHVVLYDMLIPIGDILLAKQSAADLHFFMGRLEGYGKMYDDMLAALKLEFEKPDNDALSLVVIK